MRGKKSTPTAMVPVHWTSAYIVQVTAMYSTQNSRRNRWRFSGISDTNAAHKGGRALVCAVYSPTVHIAALCGSRAFLYTSPTCVTARPRFRHANRITCAAYFHFNSRSINGKGWWVGGKRKPTRSRLYYMYGIRS
ncbi:hypothetical protein EGW08_005597 [Elysia chlorotica]|uniref:Uncharacterized protein n=1 Tax=Elysia chlorotica TaxID=188477 RepID=A0A433TYR8_ELYCH|nr:hypothetical protein EGW08_005597 [Elysia chlorotica]